MLMKALTDKQVLDHAETSREKRMRWWHEARFGMFVHWGLYSQLGRHEWVMNRERIPIAEYEKLADTWKPGEWPMREWAKLAVDAGMKYVVLTTKHHEGFCLWDTEQTPYNAVRRGPGRDLVRPFVEACREAGLKVGFYYSLMDWHHPDGARCARDAAARRRFLDFTQGCVRELMSNYGKVDILWYDVSWPLTSPKLWESAKMNAMVRRLQPGIIINNRSQLDEDFGTPEEQIVAENPGRAWEACMTFNGSWGYFPTAPDSDWHSSRAVIGMLQTVTAEGGNLLLNIGPAPDGTVPLLAPERLLPVGRWLARHGEAVYGKVDRYRPQLERFLNHGAWTLAGTTAYYWTGRWVGKEMVIGGLKTKVKRITLLDTGAVVAFEQSTDRLVMRGLPAACPDPEIGYAVFKMEFEKKPRQVLGYGCVVIQGNAATPGRAGPILRIGDKKT
jgi:alpha-L-fucosidase